MSPNEADVLQEAAEGVRDYVVSRWPVDTGTSADSWEVEISVSPGSYGFTISNDIDYVEWVHNAGTPSQAEGGAPLWQSLIGEGWQMYRSSLLSALTAEVARSNAEIAARSGDILSIFRQPIRVARVPQLVAG